MKQFKYLILLTAIGITGCGSESTEEIKSEETPVVESPAVEVTVVEEETVVEQETEVNPIKEVDLTLAVPKDLRINSSIDSVTISWGGIPNATGYQIYHQEGDDVTANGMIYYTNVSSFTHENVAGSQHSYRVQAVMGNTVSELSNRMTTDLTANENELSDSSFAQ